MFEGYLTFAKSCAACGFDLQCEDAGDGPAVFVIFIVGFLIIPLALGVHMAADWPLWLTALVWLPIMVLACMALLRPLRGLMLNVQIKNGAAQAELDDEGAEISSKAKGGEDGD